MEKGVLIFGAIVLFLVGSVMYFHISGDLSVCRIYYPEMSLPACYFSSKTVHVPGVK